MQKLKQILFLLISGFEHIFIGCLLCSDFAWEILMPCLIFIFTNFYGVTGCERSMPQFIFLFYFILFIYL